MPVVPMLGTMTLTSGHRGTTTRCCRSRPRRYAPARRTLVERHARWHDGEGRRCARLRAARHALVELRGALAQVGDLGSRSASATRSCSTSAARPIAASRAVQRASASCRGLVGLGVTTSSICCRSASTRADQVVGGPGDRGAHLVELVELPVAQRGSSLVSVAQCAASIAATFAAARAGRPTAIERGLRRRPALARASSVGFELPWRSFSPPSSQRRRSDLTGARRARVAAAIARATGRGQAARTSAGRRRVDASPRRPDRGRGRPTSPTAGTHPRRARR